MFSSELSGAFLALTFIYGTYDPSRFPRQTLLLAAPAGPSAWKSIFQAPKSQVEPAGPYSVFRII